jgi:hypothetical protein
MEQTRPDVRATGFAAGASLVLAACAAALFIVGDAIGFVRPGTEGVFTLAYVAGWVLLTAGILVGVVAVVSLIRGIVSSRVVGWVEALLMVAAGAVIAGVVWTHPFAGTGSGAG